jgi:archaetidylinositol phosphate synthase
MSHNTVIHRLIRPPVRVAARTGLTPNQVTTMRLASGLAAAAIFALGTYGWMAFGGAVFLFSILLDRADGELARQTSQSSVAGHRYDLVADCVASIATFIGLGIGITHTTDINGIGLGAVAGLGIGALFFEINVLKVVPVSGNHLFEGRVIVDPDDAMIFVPILVWCGLAVPMVVAAAVITPLAASCVGALGLRRKRASGSRSERRVGLPFKARP